MAITVFGAVFVDIKGYPQDLYIPTGRNVGRIEQVHGGVGRNVAEDIANAGFSSTFISCVDNNGSGEDVIEHLKQQGVITDYLLKKEDGMGTWLALFGNNGDVIGSISKRPDLSSIRDILKEHGDEVISTCDSIALELDLDEETDEMILKLAEKYNKKVYALISNMSIGLERRKFLQRLGCFVCNQQESGMLFSADFSKMTPEELLPILKENVVNANIPSMVVTMGDHGAVYADNKGNCGICPPKITEVKDTTGAGDAFFAGVCIGLTYGKSLMDACKIGTHLASSVIALRGNVCPHFEAEEFGF